jgi:hypothetical protein
LAAKVSGFETDLFDPLARRADRDHPFPVYAASPWRERDIERVCIGWDTGDLPSQGKKLRVSNPTRTRLAPRRSACGASGPCALLLGWHAPWSRDLPVHTPWGGTLFRAVLEQGLFRREPGVLFKTKFKTKFYLPFRLLLTMSILHVISSIPLSWHIRLSNVMHVCVFVCVCVCVCVCAHTVSNVI